MSVRLPAAAGLAAALLLTAAGAASATPPDVPTVDVTSHETPAGVFAAAAANIVSPAASVSAAPLPARSTVKVHVGSAGQTVLGNLTVTGATGAGYTTAYPCNTARPQVSTNNFVAGQTIPNFTAVKADPNGDICLYTSASTHLLWDQVSETTALTAGTPKRILDTRGPSGTAAKPAAGLIATLDAGAPGRILFGNLTVSGPASSGYTTVYACANGRPATSNSNFVAGQTIPNFVAVKADAKGKVCIYSNASTHVLFDQLATSDTVAIGAPVRKMDTRQMSATPLRAGTSVKVHTGGPNETVFGNVTVTGATTGGYTTAYPCAEGRPASSNNNYVAGRTIANFAAVKADAAGDVCFYTSGTAHMLFDQVGSVTAPAAHTPARLLDSRDPDDNHWAPFATWNGQNVAWQGCPTEIGVWASYGTSGAEEAAVRAAIAKVRDASNLPLTYKGTVNVTPTKANHSGYDLRGGSDIIFSFATTTTSDLLPGGVAGGVGGFRYTQPSSGPGSIVYGYTVIDTDVIATLTPATKMAVYAHELGHAVGLGHYTDPRQVMSPTLYNTSGLWGNGDRTGLATLGRSTSCLK